METKIESVDLPITILVDEDHLGVRLLIPLLGFAGIVLAILLTSVIQAMVSELVSGLCITIALAIVLVAVLTQIGERIIKPRWPSDRYVVLSEEGLSLHHRNVRHQSSDKTFLWADEPFIHNWYWDVNTRKARVQRGWYCMSLRVSSDEAHVTLYTFMSPEDAAAIPRFHAWFVHLLPKAEREQLSGSSPRDAAVQSRYKTLESERWLDGAEVSSENFKLLINVIARHARPGSRGV